MIQRIKIETIAWSIVAALTIAPALLWAAMKPLSMRFTSTGMSFTSMGQLLGLTGMTLFSLTLALSTRHPSLDRWFNGIDQAYRAHHKLGAMAFSLLLFHPIMLALAYASVSINAAAQFLLSTDPAILFGTIALLSMMFFLILTLFISFAYDKWKVTHKFLVMSFLFASLHTLTVQSDVKGSGMLYAYMLLIVALGAAAAAYRTLFPNLFVSRIEYIVDDVRELGAGIVRVVMSPTYKPLTHKAGQFIFASFCNDAVGKEWHPFSIASAPGELQLVIGIKTLGDHTGKFKLIPKGTVVKIEGPFGSFSNRIDPNRNQLWIAGGIGITPFLSMAKDLRGVTNNVKLYYCTKEKGEGVFLEELMRIAEQKPSFSVVPFCSSERGHISATALETMVEDLFTREIFVCGPPTMMTSLKKQLIKRGMDPAYIHAEEFAFR